MKLHTGMAVLMVAAAAGTAGAATSVATPVEGPDALAVQTETVHFDAAQIQDRKAAEKLFFRIRQAAEDVCRLSNHPHGYEIWDSRSCEMNAVAQAVDAADVPALDRYYYGSDGALLDSRR